MPLTQIVGILPRGMGANRIVTRVTVKHLLVTLSSTAEVLLGHPEVYCGCSDTNM